MNRMEEYNALMQELDETPARLNFTVARAKVRTRRQKIRRYVGTPAVTLSAVCVAFVLLVNVSMPFAVACSKIPFLKDLAEAVSFNPSLSAAVENEWVQPIGQTDCDNGYSMTVEYVIVDQKQLNIFYTLEDFPEGNYHPVVDVLGTDGEELDSYGANMPSISADGQLHHMTIEFVGDRSMPDNLLMDCAIKVHEREEDTEKTVANFMFKLSFDPQFTMQGRVVEVNKWVELDDQHIQLIDMEVYPTHIRLNFNGDPDNTAWMRSLRLYVEDENGVYYDGAGGISAVGSDDPSFRSFHLDSTYFSGGEHLTVHITGAEWQEKDRKWTWVDLSTGETGFMPEGVTLSEYTWNGSALNMKFLVERGGWSACNPFMQWRVPGGEENYFSSYGVSTVVQYEDEVGPGEVVDGCSEVMFTLENFTGDKLELEMNYTDLSEYEVPIKIPIS